ncbi:MAG: gfo/Idh/MocA family oxidoreductase [Micromonosporaceae bacterium]|nr:gfo/Idh/MocA family oxidoreductase [Micromonosporaceae bacterium]
MLNAGMIGLGAWGRKLVESVQGRSAEIRIVAGCTRTASRAASFAAAHGITLHPGVAELVADPAVEAVISTGPAGLHAEHTLAAIEAGKPVLAVKPLALSGSDAARLAAAAERRQVLLALGYNRYFYPNAAELRRRVRAGEVGELLHAEGDFCTDRFHTLPPDHWALEDAHLLAGALADHPLYSMIELLGRVRSVDARAGSRGTGRAIIDTTAVLLRFESGVSGLLTAAGATAPYERLTYFGSLGWVETRGRTLSYRYRSGEEETAALPELDAERAQLECFAAAVRGRATFPVPVEDAVHGVAVLEAIDRSARTDRPIEPS